MAWNKQLHHSQILKELKNLLPVICHILVVIRCIDEFNLTHLLFTPNFYFGHNMKNLTWADWNCELVFCFIMPKT